jgi:hypothetical protein
MRQSFSWRKFISFGLFIALLILLVSGLVLYLSPHGRGGNWSGWQFIGLSRSEWQHQHIIFSFGFALLSICHLFFINWTTFLCYLKTRTMQGFKTPAELITILLLAFVFGIGTWLDIQPFSAVIHFGREVSRSREQSALSIQSPHSEHFDPLINEKEQEHGTGFGQKTLRQIAGESGISPTSLQLALRKKGIDAETDTPLKTIAEMNGMAMRDLRELLENISNQGLY